MYSVLRVVRQAAYAILAAERKLDNNLFTPANLESPRPPARSFALFPPSSVRDRGLEKLPSGRHDRMSDGPYARARARSLDSNVAWWFLRGLRTLESKEGRKEGKVASQRPLSPYTSGRRPLSPRGLRTDDGWRLSLSSAMTKANAPFLPSLCVPHAAGRPRPGGMPACMSGPSKLFPSVLAPHSLCMLRRRRCRSNRESS